MSKDYQQQFDEAHEVLEVVSSDGFQILLATVEAEIKSIDVQVSRLKEEMLQQVTKRGVNSEKIVQQIIMHEARLDGLRFITSQVKFFERKKQQAVKNL